MGLWCNGKAHFSSKEIVQVRILLDLLNKKKQKNIKMKVTFKHKSFKKFLKWEVG